MRINLTKKDIINSLYMQIGFSKRTSENLLEDIIDTITESLKKHKIIKLSKFGTFSIRSKKRRVGRNPKTLEEVSISPRRVIIFKPSHVLKSRINSPQDG